MTSDREPFWKDEPDRSTTKLPPSISFGVAVLQIFTTLFMLGILIYVFYVISHILAWAVLILTLILFGLIFYDSSKKKDDVKRIPVIQEKARQQAGASLIGSAIHVAGHPLLNRDQPVVLALTAKGLKIFSYEDEQLLGILSVDQMDNIHTVVYDDERIPHIDVIDSAAQALQFSYKSEGREYTCVFRRMRNVRAIDWYHELQKARFSQVLPSS